MSVADYGTAERREQDAEMIRDPKRWPQWPWLPLKNPRRYNSAEEAFGVLNADEPTRVELRTMYDSKTRKVETYESVEAILDDGWTVD